MRVQTEPVILLGGGRLISFPPPLSPYALSACFDYRLKIKNTNKVARGEYAKLARLQSQANDMMGAPASSMTAEWQPSRSARDFMEETALHSVCGWLAALIRPPATGQDDHLHGVETEQISDRVI